MGPGCDLNCNTTSITTNNAICENVKTGYFSQCKWTNGGNLDVNINLFLIKNIMNVLGFRGLRFSIFINRLVLGASKAHGHIGWVILLVEVRF